MSEEITLAARCNSAYLSSLTLAADGGATSGLVEYLMSDAPITARDRRLLAWLIGRRVTKSPSRIKSTSDSEAAIRIAAYLVRVNKRAALAMNRASTRATDAKIVKKAIELAMLEFPNAETKPDATSVLAVRNVEKDQRVVSYIHEHMPHALYEIRKSAGLQF